MTTVKQQRFPFRNNNHSAFHKDFDDLDGYIAIDSDGYSPVAVSFSAVPSQAGRAEPDDGTSWLDAASVSRTGTGVYEITLQYHYTRLIHLLPSIAQNAAATLDVGARCGPNNVKPSTTPGTQKLVIHTHKLSDGSMVNPGAGNGIRFTARLKRS